MKFRGQFVLPFLTVCLLLSSSHAQKLIQGTVRDAESRALLPAANIQIEGTFSGTITNDEGQYQLQIKKLPATLVVSYIGYATKRVKVTADSPERIDILLQPIAYQLEPIVVTDEDPAVRIMREVIRRKQERRKRLKTYRAEAYTRQRLENDTSVVLITESISEVFWDKEKGSREVIKSRRQTSNLSPGQNFAAASYIANFYDDDIEIMGFKMIGVTHPDALKYYRFKLVGQRQRDDQIVYDIEVTPKTKLQPVFTGRISVLDREYALLEVDLVPSEKILFPPPIQEWKVHYRQQFSNFGKDFWLPVDVRLDGKFKIGMLGLYFPTMYYHQISHLTNYRVNVPLPDSLYESKKLLRVDSVSIRRNPDSLFASNPQVIPLSQKEEIAYQKLDSTMTLEKAFEPHGPLARLIKITARSSEEENSSGQTSPRKHRRLLSRLFPQFSYNRVNEFQLGLSYRQHFGKPFYLSLQGGYYTGLKKWYGGAKVRIQLSGATSLRFNYFSGTASRFLSPNYPDILNSLQTLLFGLPDYFDYYHTERFRGSLRHQFKRLNIRTELGLKVETHSSLSRTTSYNLFRPSEKQRENPPIQPGNLRSLFLELAYGEAYVPFGFVGQKRFALKIEHSAPGLLASDFAFTRYHFEVDWTFNTFLKRRMLPNTLNVRLLAGTSQGSVPPQRLGIVEGTLGSFSPFGVLKTLAYHPYEGDRYWAIFAEHNFRTVPFEILGLDFLARKNLGIILHGAIGKTELRSQTLEGLPFSPRTTAGTHQEIGIALNGLFNFFRLDGTWRLDQRGFFLTFGTARLF